MANLMYKFCQDSRSVLDDEEQAAKLDKIIEILKLVPAKCYVMSTTEFPSITGAMKQDDSYKQEIEDARKQKKEHIVKYSSIGAGVSMNSENCQMYNGKMVMKANELDSEGNKNFSNHAINLIGWDDNFSKDNFPSSMGVTENGAYLAVNSWGDGWGNNGFFWISYQDYFIDRDCTGILEVSENKVKLQDEDVTLQYEECQYNGKERTPKVKGSYNGEDLVKDTDYTVEYSDNINAGTATVTIKGIGRFKGTITKQFEIEKSLIEIRVGNYKGTYDKESHSLQISYHNMSAYNNKDMDFEEIEPDQLTVRFMDENGEYTLKQCPSYTDAGEYTIGIKVTSDNFDDNQKNAKITINPKELTASDMTVTLKQDIYTYTGKEIKPVVTIKDGETVLTKDKDYTVKYENNTNVGTGKIKVTGTGNYTGTVTKDFTINKANPSYEVPSGLEADYGMTLQDVTLPSGFTWDKDLSTSVGNPGENEFECTYTPEDTNNYNTVKGIKVKIKVNDKKDISVATVTLEKEKYTYTGKEIKPTVTVKYEETELTKDQDYTVKYESNTNAGTAKVTITGTGIYKGTVKKEFTISKANPSYEVPSGLEADYGKTLKDVKLPDGFTWDKDLSTSVGQPGENEFECTYTPEDTNNYNTVKGIKVKIKVNAKDITAATITLEKEKYTYTGKEIKPAIAVKYGETELTKDQDYTVKYENNINAGTATVVVEGKGIYKGSNSKTYTINSKDITTVTMTLEKEKYTYTGKEIKPNITAVDGDVTLEKEKDYTLEYSDNVNVGTATLGVKGKGNYTGSKTYTYEISKSDMKITSKGYTGVYDKKEHQIVINTEVPKTGATIKYGTTKGEYAENDNPKYKDVGEYVIYYKVTADNYNDFEGEETIKITEKNVSEISVTLEKEEYTYTKANIIPNITVKDGNDTLEEGRDYTVECKDNQNTGTATITVKGKENYTGSISKTFKIVKAEPSYVIPSGLTTIYEKTLKDVELPEGFTWEDELSTPVGEVGENEFKCTYTPEDTENYNKVSGIKVKITVYEKLEISIKEYDTLNYDNKTLCIEDIIQDTTIKRFKENIKTTGEIQIYDNKNQLVTNENEIIKTGMKLEIQTELEKAEYILIVKGDVTGDGKADEVDLLKLARYLANLDKNLEGVYLLAGNVYKDENDVSNIDEKDLLRMARILAGLEDF